MEESPEIFLKRFKECIISIIDSEKPNNKQVWELANYYEDAQNYYLKSDLITAQIVLQQLRTLPEADPRLAIIRARAEGYSDAMQAASSLKSRTVPNQLRTTTVSTEPNLSLLTTDNNGEAVNSLEGTPPKNESIKRVRPSIKDV